MSHKKTAHVPKYFKFYSGEAQLIYDLAKNLNTTQVSVIGQALNALKQQLAERQSTL